MSKLMSILKPTMNVAFATFLSRILGLFRVMFESMVLGGGAVASGWQLAFMIPNMFRRLFGEGALGTALIPVLVHTEEKEGLGRVRADLAVVFAALGCILAFIVILCSAGAMLIAPHVHILHWKIALNLLPLLMPYTILICFAGVIGAVLNSRKEFFLPALGAVLLNIFLIAGLAAGYWVQIRENWDQWIAFLDVLAYLVLASGAVQLGLLLLLLKIRGVFPAFRKESFKHLQVLPELWHLVLPGMIGGAALQLSFLADRLLAAYLGPQAVPALTYTDRLIDLPIGLFAVGMGSVLMANMSRSAAKQDFDSMREDLEYGLDLVWFCCIPIAIYLVLFREPLLRLLLFRGNFTLQDLHETAWATLFLGMGLPFFCSMKVILPAFYARKQVFWPLKVSILCIVANFLMNLALMWPLRQGGLALATVLSSLMNNSLLLAILYREGIRIDLVRLGKNLGRAVFSGAIAGTSSLLLPVCARCFGLRTGGITLTLILTGILFGLAYLGIHWLCGGRDLQAFLLLLRRRKKGNSGNG